MLYFTGATEITKFNAARTLREREIKLCLTSQNVTDPFLSDTRFYFDGSERVQGSERDLNDSNTTDTIYFRKKVGILFLRDFVSVQHQSAKNLVCCLSILASLPMFHFFANHFF